MNEAGCWKMRKYLCEICGFEYDPAVGIPEEGIPAGTPFEDLPADFKCPLCGAPKSEFLPIASDDSPRAVDAIVSAVIPRTPSIKSFRLEMKDRAQFLPGQYVKLSLEDNVDYMRCLSISNSPTEGGYVEVTKRITGSAFSQRLNEIEAGARVSVAFPFGSFTLEKGLSKVAMLSGGIGITPLRSMARYIFDSGLSTDVCLLYSNRSVDEIAFREDFECMCASCANIRVVHTVSRVDACWNGKVGRIDAPMIREEIPDYSDRCFFVCGPPPMVDSMTRILSEELLLPSAQLRVEHFQGY